MKKLIFSLLFLFAASVSMPMIAQDGKANNCPKTECNKPCKKDGKDCPSKDNWKKDKCKKSKDCKKSDNCKKDCKK